MGRKVKSRQRSIYPLLVLAIKDFARELGEKHPGLHGMDAVEEIRAKALEMVPQTQAELAACIYSAPEILDIEINLMAYMDNIEGPLVQAQEVCRWAIAAMLAKEGGSHHYSLTH